VFGLIAVIACWSTYSTWTSSVQLRQRARGR
jgi:hypothetical protein